MRVGSGMGPGVKFKNPDLTVAILSFSSQVRKRALIHNTR
jgi:hypothetical protein